MADMTGSASLPIITAFRLDHPEHANTDSQELAQILYQADPQYKDSGLSFEQFAEAIGTKEDSLRRMPDRGALKEIFVTGPKRGVRQGIAAGAKALHQALPEGMGPSDETISDIEEELESDPSYQKGQLTETSPVVRALAGGTEQAAQSMTGAIPGLAVGAGRGAMTGPGGAVIGGAIGAATSGGTIFGPAEHYDFMREAHAMLDAGMTEELISQGVPEAQARTMAQQKVKELADPLALRSAVAEGGFEAVGNFLDIFLFGKGASALTGPVKQTLKQKTLQGLRQYGKNVAKLSAVEVPSEMATTVVQHGARKPVYEEAGIQAPDLNEQLKDTAAQTLAASAIGFGPIATGGQMASRQVQVNRLRKLGYPDEVITSMSPEVTEKLLKDKISFPKPGQTQGQETGQEEAQQSDEEAEIPPETGQKQPPDTGQTAGQGAGLPGPPPPNAGPNNLDDVIDDSVAPGPPVIPPGPTGPRPRIGRRDEQPRSPEEIALDNDVKAEQEKQRQADELTALKIMDRQDISPQAKKLLLKGYKDLGERRKKTGERDWEYVDSLQRILEDAVVRKNPEALILLRRGYGTDTDQVPEIMAFEAKQKEAGGKRPAAFGKDIESELRKQFSANIWKYNKQQKNNVWFQKRSDELGLEPVKTPTKVITPADRKKMEDKLFADWQAKANSKQYTEADLVDFYKRLEDEAFTEWERLSKSPGAVPEEQTLPPPTPPGEPVIPGSKAPAPPTAPGTEAVLPPEPTGPDVEGGLPFGQPPKPTIDAGLPPDLATAPNLNDLDQGKGVARGEIPVNEPDSGLNAPDPVYEDVEGEERGWSTPDLVQNEKIVPGNKGRTYLPDNTQVDFRYAVVDLDDLIYSHDIDFRENPNFPKAIQPRDRGAKAARLQVEKMANTLNPERLTQSPDITSGSPIIGPDFVVEIGNGRSLAIEKALANQEKKLGEAYVAWVKRHAQDYGIDPGAVATMRKPVLVRARMNPVNRVEFARAGNQTGVGESSSLEYAQTDADEFTEEDIALLSPDEDGALDNAKNRGFINRFVSKLHPSQMMGYLLDDGRPSTTLYRRITAAIFHKAYHNDSLTKLLDDDENNDTKNLINGLKIAAPTFIKLAQNKRMTEDLDLIPHIIRAVELLREAKKEGSVNKSINSILSQRRWEKNRDYEEVSPTAGYIARGLAVNYRSGQRQGTFLKSLADDVVDHLEVTSQTRLPGMPEPVMDTEASLKKAYAKSTEGSRYAGQVPEYDAEVQHQGSPQKGDVGREQTGGGQEASAAATGDDRRTVRSLGRSVPGRTESGSESEGVTPEQEKSDAGQPADDKDRGLFANEKTGRYDVKFGKPQQLTLDFTAKPESKNTAATEGLLPRVPRIVMRSTGRVVPGVEAHSVEDVAQLFTHLNLNPQERFFSVLTDKAGRILEIHQYTRGTAGRSYVDANDVLGRALKVDGAKRIYFVHNHPGQTTNPSPEDMGLHRALNAVSELAGLETKALIVSHGHWAEYNETGKFSEHKLRPVSKGRGSTPIKEREHETELIRSDDATPIHDNLAAQKIIEQEFGNQDGFLLLNAGNHVVGFLPFPSGKSFVKSARTVMSAVEEVGARALIVNSPSMDLADPKNEKERNRLQFVRNVLPVVGVHIHDINSKGNSLAGAGTMPRKQADLVTGAQTLNSKKILFKKASETKPAGTKGKVEKAIAPIKELVSPETWDAIEVVQHETDLPDEILDHIIDKQAFGAPGVFYGGKVYIVADNIVDTGQTLELTLSHELRHKGIYEFRKQLAAKYADAAKANKEVDYALNNIYLRHAREINKLGAKGGLYEGIFDDLPAGEKNRRLTEEWIADNPDIFGEDKWYDKYIAAIRNLLRTVAEKLGIKMEFSDAEIRDFLRKSTEALRGPVVGVTDSGVVLAKGEPKIQKKGMPLFQVNPDRPNDFIADDTTAAENKLPEIKSHYEKKMTRREQVITPPHFLAKKYPEFFGQMYGRQRVREHEQKKRLSTSLGETETFWNLTPEQSEEFSKLVFALDGIKVKSIPEWIIDTDDGAQINEAHYPALHKYVIDKMKVSEPVADAFIEVRKSLDRDLMTVYWAMHKMPDVEPGTVADFRKKLGQIHNYFPHARYGNHYLQIVDKSDIDEETKKPKVLYREHFYMPGVIGKKVGKTGSIANKIAQKRLAKILAEHPHLKNKDLEVQSDAVEKVPESVFMIPIPVEALEQVVAAASKRISDPETQAAFKSLLPQAVSDVLKARGFGSHMIKRKDIPGMETRDVKRVIFDYKSGLFGWLTKMEASQDFTRIMSAVDAQKRPVEYEAMRTYAYDMLRNADALDRFVGTAKSVFFVKYLGGNLKTAALNLSQNMIAGWPRLGMETGGAGAKLLSGAFKKVNAVFSGDANLTDAERRLLKDLLEDGTTQANYIEEVMGQVAGGYRNTWNRVVRFMALPMTVAERFNRTSLALAAYEAASTGQVTNEKTLEKYGYKAGDTFRYEDALAFVEEVVDDAHFVYGKANRPELFRGSVAGRAASSMYTFRTFSHQLLNLWAAMLREGPVGRKAFAKSIAAMVALGGIGSIPLYKTFMHVIRQSSGDDWGEEYILENLSDGESSWLRDLVAYGLPGLAGVNLGGSLGMELPMGERLDTNKTLTKQIWTNFGELIGVPAAIFEDGEMAIRAMNAGDGSRALEYLLPSGLANIPKAIRLGTEGAHTISGTPVALPGTDEAAKLGAGAMIARMLGFADTKTAKAWDLSQKIEDFKSYKLAKQSKFANRIANALASDGSQEEKSEKIQKVLAELQEWNLEQWEAGRPEYIINLKQALRSRTEVQKPPKYLRQKALEIGQNMGF